MLPVVHWDPLQLNRLDADSLRTLSGWFASMAATLADMAGDKDRLGERRAATARHRTAIRSAADMIAAYRLAGKSRDQAVAAVAAQTGFPIPDLEIVHDRASMARARAERDRRIAADHAAGMPPAAVAVRHHVHPKSVPRIVRRVRQAG